MTIQTDRLREIANPVYVPCVGQDEAIAIATELLACREEREKHITAMAAIAQRHLDAVAERDAVTRHRDDLLAICQRDSDAAYEAVLSGRASKTKFGAMMVRDAVAELVEQRDAARAEAESLRDQRDRLLRAVRGAGCSSTMARLADEIEESDDRPIPWKPAGGGT